MFNEILNLTQALYDYEIQVDEIHFGARSQVTLKIGEIDVELGTSDSLNGKIAALHDTLPVLEGTGGNPVPGFLRRGEHQQNVHI